MALFGKLDPKHFDPQNILGPFGDSLNSLPRIPKNFNGATPDSLLSGLGLPDVSGGFASGNGKGSSYDFNDGNITEQDIISALNNWRGEGLSETTAALINYLLGEFSAQRNRDFQSYENDLAYKRQRYETDLAYDRTKFATLYNQYLAAGLSPAAALQAAAGQSADTAGSAPAAAGGAQGSGANATPGYRRADAIMNAVNTGFQGMQTVSDIVAQYVSLKQQRTQFNASLAESQRQFNSSLAETQREFNVSNFDEVQAFQGSNKFYDDTAPLFYMRGKKSGMSPLAVIRSADMSSSDIANAIDSDDFPELSRSLEDNSGNPYYAAALRHFLKSELGSRAYASNQRNLQLQNSFLEDRITAQEISNKMSNLTLAEYNSSLYALLQSAVKNDSAFRERYGITFDGKDYIIPFVTCNDGTSYTDVRLTDYIGMMSDGRVDNLMLQGMSYLDLLSFTGQFQALTLQTDLDLYNANRQSLLNDAKSRALMSAVDYICSQTVYSTLSDNTAFDVAYKVKTFMDRSGLGDLGKSLVQSGLQLYGIRSNNRNAAMRNATDNRRLDILENTPSDFEESSYFDNNSGVHYRTRVYR